MANVFKPRRSNTPSSVPTTGDIADGELAVNSADKIIYLRDGGSIVEVANYSTGTGGGGESYWVQTDVGIHTLSNVGIGTTNSTSKLTVDGHTELDDLNVSGVSTFQGNVILGTQQLRFNTSSLNISHNNTDALFLNGKGDIRFGVNNNGSFIIERFLSETIAKFTHNGPVELYYDNSKKFETTGIGATVFGTLETQQLNVSGVTTSTSFSGSGENLTGIVTSITAGTGVSVDQSTGEVTITSSATEHKILDDISSSFNGSTTQFTISSSSTNFLNSEITTAARLLISVGGVVQQPDPTQTNGYYISGGTDLSTDPIKINFVEAPKAGQVFFGVAYGLTVSPTSAFTTAEQSIAYSITFGV